MAVVKESWAKTYRVETPWYRQKIEALRKRFATAVDPDGMTQSEFFNLRRQGFNPLTVKEAKERIAKDGGKANAYKSKVDTVYMYLEEIPIRP